MPAKRLPLTKMPFQEGLHSMIVRKSFYVIRERVKQIAVQTNVFYIIYVQVGELYMSIAMSILFSSRLLFFN